MLITTKPIQQKIMEPNAHAPPRSDVDDEVQKFNLINISKGIIDELPVAALRSSDDHNENHGVGGIRLNKTCMAHAWCGRTGQLNEVTMDMLSPFLVTAVALQGRANHDQWPTKVKCACVCVCVCVY